MQGGWPLHPLARARPHIEAAIRRTPLPDHMKPTISELEKRIVTGDARLWLDVNSAALTEISAELNITPTQMVMFAGGDLTELLEMCRQAELLGRHLMLDQMVIEDARAGWERVLAPFGYSKRVRLVKDL